MRMRWLRFFFFPIFPFFVLCFLMRCDVAAERFVFRWVAKQTGAEAYYHRGCICLQGGRSDSYDCAIENFSHAIEINPRYAEAYHIRAMAYYLKKEYDKAWEDVHKAQDLGLQVRYRLLKDLRQASGRDK